MMNGFEVTHSITHDVIMPARGEGMATMGPTLAAFRDCPLIGKIIVVDDGLPKPVLDDLNWFAGSKYGLDMVIVKGPEIGKGQAVMSGLPYVTEERVIFCDADLHGFTRNSAQILAAAIIPDVMIIGVTEYREGVNVPWPVPIDAWIAVSGERSVPLSLVSDLNLHGYCMEVQINAAAQRAGIPLLAVELSGVTDTPRWGPRREAERRRDAAWLRENPI
jgi:hypothetical protein